MTQNLYLASASPRRKVILEQLGIFYTVVNRAPGGSRVNEKKPEEFVTAMARTKAERAIIPGAPGIVLAADTIVHIEGEILGKPKGRGDAVRMLKLLSGRWHEVYSGLALRDTAAGTLISGHAVTRVRFRDLSREVIEWYCNGPEPFDKAGAYGIQEIGAVLVDRIEGDFYNVVGLPVGLFVNLLQEIGHPIETIALGYEGLNP